jgi:formiminoglutamase
MSHDDRLEPTSPELFYSRRDPQDPRLGDRVRPGPVETGWANAVIVGCPQDEGVARNQGRVGAKAAPAEIRRALYRYPVTAEHAQVRLADAGDIRPGASLEETHARLHAVVGSFLDQGLKVIVLGGGNDISYPDCSALAARVEPLLVFNIDRHLDLRSAPQRNSGTPYRLLLEEGRIAAGLFHEVGINSFANSQAYLEYAAAAGIQVHFLGDLRAAGVGTTIAAIVAQSPARGIFWGFDLDVVRAVEAPGVSDPSPMGLSAREVCEIADVAARDPRTRLLEISEVNPTYDRDGITSKLAANIIMRALAGSGQPGGGT